MLKKTSKTVLLIVSIVTVFSFCFAEAENRKTIMTLDEAVIYAMNNNPNILDLQRMEESQEDTYEKG